MSRSSRVILIWAMLDFLMEQMVLQALFFSPTFVCNFFFMFTWASFFKYIFVDLPNLKIMKCLHLVTFSGQALDILARVPLWKDGLDYRHGTGHGIGSYLNVHEGNWWMTTSGFLLFSAQFNLSACFLFVPLLCRTSYD